MCFPSTKVWASLDLRSHILSFVPVEWNVGTDSSSLYSLKGIEHIATRKRKLCRHIISLRFSSNFDQPLFNALIFPQLQRITFDFAFNQALNGLSVCRNLEYLELGKSFDKSLRPLRSCKKIKVLKLGYNFKQYINVTFENLEYLRLGYCFNESLEFLKGSPKLKYLEVGWLFNQPIHNNLVSCTQLNTLILSQNFNRDIIPLGLCENLEHLEINNSYFSQYLSPLIFCKKLKTIKLDHGYRKDNRSLRVLKHINKDFKVIYKSSFR